MGSDLRGAQFDAAGGGQAANLDGADLRNAQVSAAPGQYQTMITNNHTGKQLPVMISFQSTRLGPNTTGRTICPMGTNGPC